MIQYYLLHYVIVIKDLVLDNIDNFALCEMVR